MSGGQTSGKSLNRDFTIFLIFAPTHRALAPPEVAQSTRIQKNSGSAHRGLSKTVPTAPLAPFPAELGAFEVWAFLTKIGVATTESDVFFSILGPRGAGNDPL